MAIIVRSHLLALAVVALAASGCGGGAAESHGAAEPAAQVTGNDAVRARLAALPALPISPALEIRAMTEESSTRYCGWQTSAFGAEGVETSCPDGSTVRIQAACDAEAMGSMREGLAECPMTVGEWAACVAARRQSPCDGGLFGERLPECEAFAACIAAAMEESQEAAQSAGTEPE